MNESERKRTLVASINAMPSAYARRLEDRWAVGVLDLIIKLPTHQILWAEGKIIDGLQFGPSERQYVEGLRIQKAGMKALLLGWKGRTMFISRWVKKAHVDDCFHSEGQSDAEALWAYLERGEM